MRQGPGKTVWVGRAGPAENGYVGTYIEVREGDQLWEEADYLAEFCVEDFSQVTGLHLEPGERFRAEIRVYLETPQEAADAEKV